MTFKLILIFTLLSTTTSAYCEITMSDENEKKHAYYFLTVASKGLAGIIGINQAPLVMNQDGEHIITTESVNSWLMPGENTITLQLKPLPTSEDKPQLEIKLYLHDDNEETPTPKTILANYSYPATSQEQTQHPQPLIQSIPFRFDQPVAARLWTDAEQLQTLTEKDKEQIANLAKKMAVSITHNTVEESLRLQDYKIKDEALSEGKTEDRLRAVARSNYEWVGQQTALSAAPTDEAALSFCANNKIVYVSRKTGGEILQFSTDEMDFEIPLFVAKIKGEWTIVR